jgi:hypothetical protein
MASTFSPLKFELIGTGEQDGSWGDTTNTNIGTAIEQAITGSGDVTFSSADVTLTLTNTNAGQIARNLRLVCVGTSGGARQLIVPAIEKQYIVQNNLADTVTIKPPGGATGIAIPSGKTTVVFNDGTNIVEVVNFLANVAIGANFAIQQVGSTLVFQYNGSNVATLSSTGTLTATTITAA